MPRLRPARDAQAGPARAPVVPVAVLPPRARAGRALSPVLAGGGRGAGLRRPRGGRRDDRAAGRRAGGAGRARPAPAPGLAGLARRCAPPTATSCVPTCASTRTRCPATCASASTSTPCAPSTPPTRAPARRWPALRACSTACRARTPSTSPPCARCWTAPACPTRSTPSLVRGLDYYTRTVFEFESAQLGAQSGVGGGGRYDGLVEQLGGPPTAGLRLGGGHRAHPAGRRAPAGRAAGGGAVRGLRGRARRDDAFALVSDARRAGLAAQLELAGRSLEGPAQAGGTGRRALRGHSPRGARRPCGTWSPASSATSTPARSWPRCCASAACDEAPATQQLPRHLVRAPGRVHRRQPPCAWPAGCTAAATTGAWCSSTCATAPGCCSWSSIPTARPTPTRAPTTCAPRTCSRWRARSPGARSRTSTRRFPPARWSWRSPTSSSWPTPTRRRSRSTRTCEVDELLRMRHRPLDLRRPRQRDTLLLRHRVAQTMRAALSEQDFVEVETPMLTRSTPEGARDYLVPSRNQRGSFYALPQSPQLFKQLLMVAGLERYFQIVRCFRDEDPRADRQPEFTQLDLEMSFVEEEDVIAVTEAVMSRVFEATGFDAPAPPWPREPFDAVVARYGTDRPDRRFGLEIEDLGAGAGGLGVPGVRRRAGRRRRGAGHQRRRARGAALGAGRHDRAGQAAGRQGPGVGVRGGGRRLALADRQVPVGRGDRARERSHGSRSRRPAAGRRRPGRGGQRGAGSAAPAPGRAVRPHPRRPPRPAVGHRLPDVRLERRRGALGRAAPSLHPAGGIARRPGRPALARVRPGDGRVRAGGRLDPHPRDRDPASRVRADRDGGATRHRPASASCSTRCATAHRRTAGSRWASTVWCR